MSKGLFHPVFTLWYKSITPLPNGFEKLSMAYIEFFKKERKTGANILASSIKPEKSIDVLLLLLSGFSRV